MDRLDDILEKVRSYNTEADLQFLTRAYVFTGKVHAGQQRRSGEPYLSHPLAVASLLADLRMDTTTISAGLLHDTIEDTTGSPEALTEEIGRLFGADVRTLVEGVTKIGKVAFGSAIEKEAANYRKMVLAMATDIRVVIIKLADRLHNMRTLAHLSLPQQQKVARETLEVYAPLAHRLGIGWIKQEMEDLAFSYLEPEVFADIGTRVAKKSQEREAYVAEVRRTVEERLGEAGISAAIPGRAKHFYSIYKKMLKQQISFDEVHDLIALRVITDSVKDCYGALGIIHSLWTPVPGRFKDYIAMPKENGYRSLHTTVVGPGGERVEFQIRTAEMNRVAEEGIAAHWKYKEGLTTPDSEERYSWLQHLMENVRETKDPTEFMERFKMDLFPNEVHVFTPKGDVRSFPRGATPVDFAYDIHTDVGHRCVGARVNSRQVPLRYELANGDRVEIVTQLSHHPNKDWLTFVRTSRARAKIKLWLRQEQRERSVALGRELLEKELRKAGSSLSKVGRLENLESILSPLGVKTMEELEANIARGKFSATLVTRRLVPGVEPEKPPGEGILHRLTRAVSRPEARGSIRVAGLDGVLFRFSKCCNPVPGDPIIGFITRGRGISIHRTDCPSMASLDAEPARRVEVEWDTGRSTLYPVRILVEGNDRPGLLAAISECISDAGANIASGKVKAVDGKAFSDFELNIRDLEQLNAILKAIRRVKGVDKVVRHRPAPGSS